MRVTLTRTRWLAAALVAFVLFGWAVGAIWTDAFAAADLDAVRDVASARTRGGTLAAHAFSWIGSGFVVLPVAAIACGALYRRARRAAAVAVALSTVGALLIVNLDKLLVGRPRPPLRHLDVVTGYSFPSAHAAHTAALCAVMVIVARSRVLAVAIASCVLVACVAISRVYLGVHYPSDVVAGALLGAGWSLVASRAARVNHAKWVMTAHPTAESSMGSVDKGEPMSDSQRTPVVTDPLAASLIQRVARWWWVGLITGAFWIVISAVVLKFNHASVTTVGILVGIMFLLAAAQELLLAVLDRHWRWLWAVFSVLLFAAGIVSLIHPRNTFAGFADILGFVFLVIGTFWTARAFTERPINDLWWLTLLAGILMIVLAFWTSGQFYLVRAATLLVFAGIWALMQGITDITRAFMVRKVAHELTGPAGHDGAPSRPVRTPATQP